MKISEAILTLQNIQARFGDIAITGGSMSDDMPLRSITVTNVDGFEIWPRENEDDAAVDGVFLE